MKFDIEDLKESSEEDYEKAWRESGDLLEESGEYFSLEDKGSSHPLFDLVQEFRKVFTEVGFEEQVVPALIEKEEIEKQYGPEAPIILDRIFFLAGLDRSDLGISEGDLDEIREEVPDFDDVSTLETILREFKKGEVDSDDLLEDMVERIGLEEWEASHILSLFEDFKNLDPVPSDMTLRSHTTAGWFPILEKMLDRKSLPIQLFTVGPKYRREQELDETHLYRSWTASTVIMAEEMSLEDGERVARKILEKVGFDEVKCVQKSATSKYYAPESEFEIFVSHPETGEMIEIGNAGFYSPVSLANYEIPFPVFNLGIGLERMLMLRFGEDDIRSIVYPYKYEELDFSDEKISQMIEIEDKPKTEEGEKIASLIENTAEQKKDKPSPCEFEVFEGQIKGKEVSVYIIEEEENTQLVGPAGFNGVFTYVGNIVGIPPEGWADNEFLQEAKTEGVETSITYIESFSNLAARKIEKAAEEGKNEINVGVKMIDSLNDINLRLERPARRYITNENKEIDVRGPFFVSVRAEFE